MDDNHKVELERRKELKNRVNQLIDVVEKHTRTERHLEQYSNISSKENLEHERRIQKTREEEIENLKDKIVYGEGYSNEAENLEAKYEKTKEYIHYNAPKMNLEGLSNLNEKQRNREHKIDSIR